MNIVIVGFGRVGSATVRELREDGHSVVLIEQRGDRIDRATRVEGLRTVRGNAIDADVQLRAGVDRADVFLALTREDTVNLVAAEVAKKKFSVPHAIARIYIPSRASIFEALGIRTICPTLYTVDAIRTTVRDIQGLPAAPRPPAETARPKARRPPALDESKFVLISGGGKIGSGLARTLAGRGIEVAIIEKDPAQVARLSAETDVPVFVGDGSARGVLETAGASRAAVFAAVTGADEDNLVACQTAKAVFGVGKTIARVSNPKNEELMRLLGVDATVATTAIISSYIEREVPGLQIRTLLSLQAGGVQLFELKVPAGSPAAGRALKDLPIPPSTNIVAVVRGGETIVTRGDTRIMADDTVLILVQQEREAEIRKLVLG
ncbi:MAG TPA: NAD-binding protein [Thermoanaerobaculia bacterium]|nr:NAD-binding protein [Thermoanaerobaculia bacterium]